jgi:hypothetical protein
MKKRLQQAIDFLIEQYYALEGKAELSEYQNGYQNACEIIVRAILGVKE